MILILATWLCDRGHKVVLITRDDCHDAPFYPIDSRLIWHRIGYATGLLGKFRRVGILARILKREAADTLIGFVMSGDLTVFMAAKLAGTRIIAAERNAPSMYWLLYSAFRREINFRQLHLADAIVVQIPRYIDGYPLTLRRKINCIANPVLEAETVAQPDLPLANGRFRLICVSRLDSPQKQIGILIEAFAQLASQYSEWDLSIIGDGPERKKLEALTIQLGLTGRVTFHGASQHVFGELTTCQLFVLPSAWEGFPNALAEAMAHGLPCVGFAGADGVSDLVGNECGWMAEGRNDPSCLADALAKAMDSPEERRRRGQTAIAAMKRYRQEDQLEKWRNLLEAGHLGLACQKNS